jgi:hypothetical protein
MNAWFALVLTALVVSAGCSTPVDVISSGNSGIRGTVLLGPNCPVEREPPDPKCADKPYQTRLTITTPDGATFVKEFESDSNGTFRVAVFPGDYAIRSAAAANTLPYCQSEGTITVVAENFTETTVHCDTGIR